MIWSLAAFAAGFLIDLVAGDPHGFPHPVILMGKLIDALRGAFLRAFPKTAAGERAAGVFIWIITAAVSAALPLIILMICMRISPWLRFAVESFMCWQIIAVKSLKDESMKVYSALSSGDVEGARYNVSMIVGRDTDRLNEAGIARAAVETVAENTSDGAVAPMFFLMLGGAPLGFFYKAANTMDSMLGYTDPPFKNIGMFSAKADDVLNFIPARISAVFMLAAGAILGLDVKGGARIFLRDRYNHKSPNSAQTESVCAGLLGIRLAGDAWYHGVLHEKPFIGDAKRDVESEDIRRACRILYATATISFLVFAAIKLIIIL